MRMNLRSTTKISVHVGEQITEQREREREHIKTEKRDRNERNQEKS